METEVVRRRGSEPQQAASASEPPVVTGKGSITVSVVHALPERVWHTTLTVPAGSSIAQVLQLSGFATQFPDYPIQSPAVGIFGRRAQVGQVVAEGDRVEVYRPLSFDPMESRRRRAEHRKAASKKGQFRPRRVREADTH